MNILLIDDSLQVRALVKSLIGDLVDHCHECNDGAEAVEAYRLTQPDWVFMDFEMKQTNGLTATRQLRAAYPDAKIIIVTQYDDIKLREAATAAGAVNFVVKDDLLALREIISP
jgi:CheY-like chemotaxis protein